MHKLVGLAALVCLTGCSVQMAYNNLDRLARWSVSDYVSMDEAQRHYFDHQFRVLWDWHRGDHLPEYADFLEALAMRFEDTATGAEMSELVARVLAWADAVEKRATPVAAELLASLSDAQIAELAVALERSNEEVAEPELGVSADEARVLWRQDFVDRFSRFSGRLNPVQMAELEARAKDYRPERVLWADYRRRLQRDFLALLAHRHDVEGLERSLRQLSAHREAYYGPELRHVYDHNNHLTREVSVWLINSLTDRQRKRFRSRLGNLAEDLRQLAADTRRRAPDTVAPCLVRC